VFRYSGPCFDLVHSYGANLAASFAVYFMVRFAGTFHPAAASPVTRLGSSPGASALVALLAVELFEATDGFFGLMTNVYDPLDYGVNALGVALAVAVDLSAAQVSNWRKRRVGNSTEDRPDHPKAA
jgi:hypothetical protein